MAEHAGFYAPVQFFPDPFLGEGVNIGVIVGSDGLGELWFRLAPDNDRVKHLLPASPLDDARLTSAKRALERKLGRVAPTQEALRRFISQEISNIVIQEPTPILLESVSAELDRLFEKLVEVDAHTDGIVVRANVATRRSRTTWAAGLAAAVAVGIGLALLVIRGGPPPGDVPIAATAVPDGWDAGVYRQFQTLEQLQHELSRAKSEEERAAIGAKITAKGAELTRGLPEAPVGLGDRVCPPAPTFVQGNRELRVSVVKAGDGRAWLKVFRAVLRDRGGKEWLPWTMTLPGTDGKKPVDMLIINSVSPEPAEAFCRWVECVGWNATSNLRFPCELRTPRKRDEASTASDSP